MAPVNSESLALAKADLSDVFGRDPADRYLTLLSGPLRVVHLFDHVLLQDVCQRISASMVTQAVEKIEHLIDHPVGAGAFAVDGGDTTAQRLYRRCDVAARHAVEEVDGEAALRRDARLGQGALRIPLGRPVQSGA